MTQNSQNNATDPQKVYEEALAAYDALAREGDSLGDQRRRIEEESMAASIDEAIANGDVRGAMASAMLDTQELDRRAAELPFELHAAREVVYHAAAAVAEHERQRFARELAEVAPLIKPAREKMEAAQAEFDEIMSRYQYLETAEDRALNRRSQAEGQAQNLRRQGPSLAPLGGVPSPLGEAVDRATSLRNLRRPQRTGVHQRHE